MTSKNNLMLDDFQIDMLKEVGNICSGNATMALSQLTNETFELTIPDFKLIQTDKIEKTLVNSQEVLIGVSVKMLGKLNGNVVLMLPEKSAYAMLDGITRSSNASGNATEYGVSTLKEIGNIVVSAYLATLSTFTRTVLLHSTPNLVCGSFETLFNISFADISQRSHQVFVIETIFSMKEKGIHGSFYLIIEPGLMKEILKTTQR